MAIFGSGFGNFDIVRRVSFISLLTVLLLATHSSARAGAASGSEHVPGTSVEMPYLIAPVVVDGSLYANAYISTRIGASSPAATIVVRDKLAFIQDAFVRDVNAAPIGKPGDPTTVDVPALSARLLADVRRIVGPGLVDRLDIIRIQINPLRTGAHS